MEFRLLGPLEVVDGRDDIAVGGGRRRALLALLLVHRNEVVPAERLIDELWDGQPPPTAAKALQVHVSQLRKDLASGGRTDGALRTRAGGYVLEVGPENVDVARFERALVEGERARADGRDHAAAERLREGLALWRGPPLVEFTYARFAQDEIARLEELHLVALEERIEADLALGRERRVIAELETLVRAHPLRERLRGQLMLALHRCGRQADALETYRDGRRHTVEQLGLEPGAELRRLEAQILADDPALTPPRRAPPLRAARAPLAILLAGLLLAGAAIAVILQTAGEAEDGAAPAAALDIAANSAVALDASEGSARFGVPLPGRPTDVAAEGDRLYAVSIDSSALTIVDGRTRRIRTTALSIRPAAVAVAGDAVWVVDGRRGLAVRMDAGYERVAARATWRRAPTREPVGLSRPDPTAIALAGGAAWVTDGSNRLVRIDVTGADTALPVAHPLDGVAAGAGAVWAISREDATLLRVDPRDGRVTDEVPIVARPGADAPAPIAVAATAEAVWVLNGNTATVSRVDARNLGITETIPIALEGSPRDIDAGAGAVWVSSFDGTVTRIGLRGGEPRSTFLGASLVGIAGARHRVWAAAIALDQQIPGG